jgi:hypothetical protein
MKWQTKMKRLNKARERVETAARVAAQRFAERESADEQYGAARLKHREALAELESEVLKIERAEVSARAKVAAARKGAK